MVAIKVNKFDAIHAQLDAAVELFFLSDNLIATHTLAAAAYNALRDIAKKQNEEHPFLKRGFLETLPESERNRVIGFLNGPENFFKHADKDHDGTIDFDAELTEILLMDAMAYFREKPHLQPKRYDVFRLWVGVIRKETIPDEVLRSFVETLARSMRAKGKVEFWRYAHELIEQHKVMRSPNPSVKRDASPASRLRAP